MKREREIDAKITISRDSRDVIRIQITDEASRLRFIEVQMRPADFAMALTGLSEVECIKTHVRSLDVVGLFRVTEPRSVVCPLDTYNKDELSAWLLANCQEPGWQIDTYLGSQSSIHRSGDGLTINYRVFRFQTSKEQQP